MELARHIEVTSPMSRARSVVQVRVSTASRRQGGTLADVGFGLSQVLPLVAREASLDSGYLVSYQPEVHLHPFAQSRLADLFVRSVERGNLVFVETHSEYLVLRVQYLVAEGKIPANAVRVFCVEPKRDRSAVRPMAFDECGRPLTRWPDGFLDTAMKLAKEIVEKRVASSVSRVSPVA